MSLKVLDWKISFIVIVNQNNYVALRLKLSYILTSLPFCSIVTIMLNISSDNRFLSRCILFLMDVLILQVMGPIPEELAVPISIFKAHLTRPIWSEELHVTKTSLG